MMMLELELEVEQIVREFFPKGLPPSQTEAAIKARRCKIITRLDEDANERLKSEPVGPPPTCTSLV